ncbi:zeta-carotene desaturase, chloroplastic/chromoplastic [Iris pallida]|nr:zeta-carotene desaturase, chloroplastic/chromoplastic [Iris pallida]
MITTVKLTVPSPMTIERRPQRQTANWRAPPQAAIHSTDSSSSTDRSKSRCSIVCLKEWYIRAEAMSDP